MSGHLDPALVFERYVVGPANRLAAAAARRAAESPGVSYNPLVICGPPGLGKTHLLTAVGHLARTVEPELYVRYETLGGFVDRLSASIAAGTLADFREAAGGVGLLLLDDLQEVAGKARTQAELVQIWEGLMARGAQIVVASDRLPHEIPALDAQLAARLAAGLIVEIGAPEPETRLSILRQMVRERGLLVGDDVLRYLAGLPIDDVRELQAALARVAAGEGAADAGGAAALLGVQPAPGREADEFGDFLTDITTAVAAVVETDPWRRRIAEAILRWEGEGVVTRRLDVALDADTAPDVDALLDGFARDLTRLRAIRRELADPEADAALFADPDRLAEAERLLAARRAAAPPPPASEPAAPRPPTSVDRWFLDREKLALDWLALDDRLIEERG